MSTTASNRERSTVRGAGGSSTAGPGKSEVEVPALGPLGLARWAWTQLTKMNTALFLLLLLAVAAVPGSIFPQRIQDPAAVQDYIDNNPALGEWLDRVQLFDVFSSAWFSAIYILLFVSLVGCVLPRAAKHWRAWRAEPPRTPRRLERLPEHRSLALGGRDGAGAPAPDDVVADAARLLRKRGYRVAVRDAGTAAPSVAAERGMWKEVGNIVFHLALLGVLVSVAVGSLFGYKGQKILVEGESFANTLIGYDSFTPGTNYDADWLEPFSVRLDSFEAVFNRDTTDPRSYGAPLDFTAEITVQEPGSEPQPETLKVNAPVNVNGVKSFLIGNGYAPVIRVTDGNGDVAFEGPVVTIPSDGVYTSSLVLKVPDARPDQLGFTGLLLPTAVTGPDGMPRSVDPGLANPQLILSSYYGDLGLDSGVPQNVYVLDVEELTELNGMLSQSGPIAIDAANPVHELPEGKGTIEFLDVKRYVGLDIVYDPGRFGAFISFVLAFTGLLMSMFISRRRVWVRAAKGVDEHGRACTVLEYGLLARGEDPRLATEAERLSELFTEQWGTADPPGDPAAHRSTNRAWSGPNHD
ncbi:cytochrome c biogenesis protein ResB [Kocuria rosea]|uniref:cytochrome c biogenesis protein ResB n=2 Tax=Kocuria rosea TaxID=1275 RepID=UPI000D64F307|nr:cytochrome c biogenesis protein ResB [Kocuria rosea]PWF82055.1 cytochrome c biogenesis protein ResB [Kocuria rosea]QCY32924.1 cytochrome c biogenesis protein ResB [Kocuria rosea]TQN33693.1 cytochrome c biogenesis protein [Kocuria rosea]